MANNSIQENLRKYFYSGVGFAAHSSDIIKAVVNDFVAQGKVSEQEGERIVGDAMHKVETRYTEIIDKVEKYASDEIGMLRKRIEELEHKLEQRSPATARTVKKVTKAIASRPIVKKAAGRVAAISKKVKAAAKKVAPKKAAKKAVKKAAAPIKKIVKKAAPKKSAGIAKKAARKSAK